MFEETERMLEKLKSYSSNAYMHANAKYQKHKEQYDGTSEADYGLKSFIGELQQCLNLYEED